MKARSALCSLAVAGISALPLPGAVIVQYSSQHAPEDSALPVDPAYIYQHYSLGAVSGFAPAEGSTVSREGGSMTFSGWGTEVQLAGGYVSFTVSALPGMMLDLDRLTFNVEVDAASIMGRSADGITTYTWAYRVIHEDEGIVTDWVFDQWRSYYDPHNTLEDGEKTWIFHDGISTTGTVEFALFAASDNPNARLTLDQITVTSWTIPEPSTVILAGLSSLVLWRRRRPLSLVA